MPAFVLITVVFPVIVVIVRGGSVSLAFFFVPPLVPMVVTIPVAIFVGIGDAAEIEIYADADSANMDINPNVLSTGCPAPNRANAKIEARIGFIRTSKLLFVASPLQDETAPNPNTVKTLMKRSR